MALIRALNSECVYLSSRQSISIQVFLHTLKKRAETPALLDLGATENFINHWYAQSLNLPVKRLPNPRKVYNVDGTTNQREDICFYTDLEVRTGENCTNMRFFLTELGPQWMILGYPWFAAVNLASIGPKDGLIMLSYLLSSKPQTHTEPASPPESESGK